jgi:hypothetical protein
MTFRSLTRLRDAALLTLVATLFSNPNVRAESAPDDKPARETPAAKPARKNFTLPGLVADFQERCVDIEATICLDQGMLELIACTKETKEHESIVTITARPMHVHTALLLLGANNGHPAMRRSIGEEGTRWVDIPPRGDPVDVYLVFSNNEGKMVEHAISDFVVRSDEHPDVLIGAEEGHARQGDKKFPKTFLFAGSLLVGDGPGPRTYLADQSGSVISIATFGDELLCLPGMHAKSNDALMWQIDAAKLPKVGSKVTLRLRLQRKPDPTAGKGDPPPRETGPPAANQSE